MTIRTYALGAGIILLSLNGLSVAETIRPDALPSPVEEDDFRPFDPLRAELGQLLFYDKILSGNRNIACSTCHSVEHGTSDGVSLGLGEGGHGVGPSRRVLTEADHPFKRVPRNAPALFNLGHRSLNTLFHDGRVSAEDSYGTGFNTPMEEWLPHGLQSIVAAQALIPLTSQVEMAGSREENDVAAAANRRIDNVWSVLVERVTEIPAYVYLFAAAFPDVSDASDITAVHIANALDDFQNSEWRSYRSPLDAFLSGDEAALTDQQKRGMEIFYGSGQCATCHSGPLLTDQQFHALGLPPLGPGRTRAFDPYARDVGRMGETDLIADAYRFRTPSLRNVALTGPWGHNGSYATLEGIVRHHLDPVASLNSWDRTQVILNKDTIFERTDFIIWEDTREMERLRNSISIEPVSLPNADIEALLAFLHTLTDESALAGRLGKPDAVPSRLSVD